MMDISFSFAGTAAPAALASLQPPDSGATAGAVAEAERGWVEPARPASNACRVPGCRSVVLWPDTPEGTGAWVCPRCREELAAVVRTVAVLAGV